MYICGICQAQTGPKVPCNILVTETRVKTYPARSNDRGGSGYETVREVHACPSCARNQL